MSAIEAPTAPSRSARRAKRFRRFDPSAMRADDIIDADATSTYFSVRN
jgi:hypothetical protein